MATSGRNRLCAGLFALAIVGAGLAAVPASLAATAPGRPAATASWVLDEALNAAVPQGSLASVSCRSATACVAVGSYDILPMVTQAMAEVWNGKSWRLSATPRLSRSELAGISCTSVDRCLAVGSAGTGPLSELWDGSSWRVLSTPSVRKALDVVLTAVSCATASSCVAVGDAETGETTTVALSESWNGSAWKLLSTPDPKGSTTLASAVLGAVDCVSPGSCTAVGSYADAENDTVTLAETWSGTRWEIQSTPDPSAGDGLLDGVGCAASSCTATGYTVTEGGETVPLTEQRSTTSWRILQTPIPPRATYSTLGGLSCSSGRSCTAVGILMNASSDYATVVEQMSGSTWTVRPSATPAGADYATLSGVSCLSTTACTAVGSASMGSTAGPGGGGVGAALAEVSGTGGSGWKLEATPDPSGASEVTALNGLSCVTAAACLSVGDYVNAAGTVKALAESFDGRTFKQANPLSRAGATSTVLEAVSCTSATSCVAVGSYDTPTVTATLSELWDGKAWRVVTTPNPAGETDSSLAGVSCTAKSCLAVGSYTTRGDVSTPLAEAWNGKAWRLVAPGVPAGSTGSALSAVSCFSADDCTAVGHEDDRSGVSLTLAEAWNGSAWKLAKTPTPTGALGSQLEGVSCPTATGCVAVGSTSSPSDIELALAESTTGTSWVMRPAASPGGEIGTNLAAVSCTATTACTAAGQAGDDADNGTLTLAEVWAGSSFKVQATRTPPSGFDDAFAGVACTAATACTAVGTYATSTNGESFALAETER